MNKGEENKRIIHSIKSILIYLIAGIVFLILGPITLLIIILLPSKINKIVVPFCKLMIFLYCCKIKIYGHFPKNKTFVVMANHTSFLDVFALPTVFPKTKKFSVVAASKNFKIPIYATFLKKLKAISINRSNREQAIKGIQQAEKLLAEDYHIVVLPEGTRSLNGRLGKFKKGGFHLASNTQAQILPIIIKGLFDIKPKHRWIIIPGHIQIYIEEPIDSENKTVDQLLEETEQVFQKRYDNDLLNINKER